MDVGVSTVLSFFRHQTMSEREPECAFQYHRLGLCQSAFTKVAHLIAVCSAVLESESIAV